MRERIFRILTELRPEFDFRQSDNFIEDGMLDSFDVIRLVTELDKEYNISIDGIDVLSENFSSIDRIVSLLNKKGITE